ncbi:MAG: alanine--tRNA ligase [Bacteroidetes bacterium]|nr:alanine--tRNA ligase [Bacteroidota bacterium]
MNSNQIRKVFLDFFKSKDHHVVSSAPMVVKNDPTLMFTNAGMNQFKDIFLGNTPRNYPRVTDSQKCLRVSGKHNDLEEVGQDTYHHTMFEMLGNWSFGDFFKKEIIEWSSELLFDVFKLSKDRVYVTVFEGDEKDGVAFDQEAYDYWRKILPESQILGGNKKDNFWEMGEVGPCGPCSEIHYDLRDKEDRDKVSGISLVNKDNPLVIEIWNIVFMQYNRLKDNSLQPLPNKHVDTGMGFERLCMLLQGKKSNYDTDIFQNLIQKLAKISGIEYGKDEKADVAMRVISDHLRAISFSIADGQVPSNAKAGYVIRRILRRAVRYGYTYLNLKEPFICKMVSTLVNQMGEQFPELKAQESLITKIIEEEELSFLRTLAIGINMLDGLINSLDAKKTLSGVDAFVLYDTYGFPFDLTELICREKGVSVDSVSFDAELKKQKIRSKNAAVTEKQDWVEVVPIVESIFEGYDNESSVSHIARYRQVTQKKISTYQIVLDKTPFYGCMGGQLGEKGFLISDTEKVEIIDTIKENNLTIHVVKTLPKNIEDSFRAQVNVEERKMSAANHTATHLLQNALRKVLGTHVEQKGSMVGPHVFRFDFSHYQKVTDEEIFEVERIVNAEIRANHPIVENRNDTIENARKSGIMMLFGEKYGEVVRSVRFGESIELCGGLHSKRTGDIGIFKIISEGAISAGIRRMEVVTGSSAVEMLIELSKVVSGMQKMLNSPSINTAVEKLLSEHSDMSKKINTFNKERNLMQKNKIKEMLETGDMDYKWSIQNLDMNVNAVKEIASGLCSEIDDVIFINGSVHEDKPNLVVALGKNIIDAGLDAGKIVRESAKVMKGGGGGQKNLATAGGKDASKIGEALNTAKTLIREQLKRYRESL